MEDIAKEVKITAADKANLDTAAKWARFIAIVNIVIIGLAVAGLLFIVLGMAVANVTLPGFTDAVSSITTVYLVVMTVAMLVALFPALYLYRFAAKALAAVEADNREIMSESLANLRRYFKFNGILLVVVIGFYILACIAFAIGFVFGGAANMLG